MFMKSLYVYHLKLKTINNMHFGKLASKVPAYSKTSKRYSKLFSGRVQ